MAVRRLVDHYADRCDHQDAAGVAALFAADGALHVRDGAYRGDDIEAFYAARLGRTTLHFTTGLRVAIRPDGLVDSTCGFAAIEMPDDGWSLATGRYVDVVRVESGAARFVSRRITVFGRRTANH